MDLAVLDPLPLFRLGVLAALGGGRELTSLDELTHWVSPGTDTVVLLTVDEDSEAWSVLAMLRQHPELRTVAVLAPFTVTTAARALRAGAAHVVPRDAEPAVLRRVLDEVVEGVVSLPLTVLRAATAAPRHTRQHGQPSDEELSWLRALAAGETVAALAARVGYSERMLYRRLTELYHRLAVTNRTQALILARDEGWL